MRDDNVSAIEIYREHIRSGAVECVATLTDLTIPQFWDTDLVAGEGYIYRYRFVCKDGTAYPDSLPAVETWPGYSIMSNLTLRQDQNERRAIYIEWDDVTGPEYRVTVTRISSNEKPVEWVVMDEWHHSNAVVFKDALPISSYRVTVYEPVTDRTLTKTITLGKAPDYTRFNAECKNGTMHWVENGKTPGQSGTSAAFDSISISNFNKKLVSSTLYGRSNYVYQDESYDHNCNALYILRGPDGNDVYVEREESLSGYPAGKNPPWYYPLDELIQKMTGTNTLTQTGDYMFEVYFDECRVSREQFTLK